jgi:hypothetical protein
VRQPVIALAAALLAVTSTIAVTTRTPEPAPGASNGRGPNPPTTTPGNPAEKIPSASAPAPPRATVAEPLTGVPYWATRDLENQIALFYGARSDVLFLGDSITDLLARGSGKLLWDAFYTPLGALDFGIVGARTSHVLWQVETGQVAIAAPKVVVLLIGTNNLTAGEAPADVAAGVEKIVNTIGAQLPETRVLLLGILPRGASANDPLRPRIAETNRRLAELADDRVTYLDIGPWFVEPNGALSLVLMPDALHPSYWGYFVYSVAIWETLTGLLSEEREE